jgi:hypothetical protein
MEYTTTSRGRSNYLTSPKLGVPPLGLQSFSFTLKSTTDTVADFMWLGQGDEAFNPNHTILLPVKVGQHEYVVPLDQCPAWFLHDSISQLRLVPTAKAQSINISHIILK